MFNNQFVVEFFASLKKTLNDGLLSCFGNATSFIGQCSASQNHAAKTKYSEDLEDSEAATRLVKIAKQNKFELLGIREVFLRVCLRSISEAPKRQTLR